MVTRQKMIVFASSIDFTTPWNILERYSLKNHFKKLQIPKIPPWHKEGDFARVPRLRLRRGSYLCKLVLT